MKKILVTIMSALLLVCSVIMVGCGSVAGTYKFEYFLTMENGVEVKINAGETYDDMIFTEDIFVVELKKDGTCSIKEGYSVVNGTWEQDGNKIIIIIDVDPIIRSTSFLFSLLFLFYLF